MKTFIVFIKSFVAYWHARKIFLASGLKTKFPYCLHFIIFSREESNSCGTFSRGNLEITFFLKNYSTYSMALQTWIHEFVHAYHFSVAGSKWHQWDEKTLRRRCVCGGHLMEITDTNLVCRKCGSDFDFAEAIAYKASREIVSRHYYGVKRLGVATWYLKGLKDS